MSGDQKIFFMSLKNILFKSFSWEKLIRESILTESIKFFSDTQIHFDLTSEIIEQNKKLFVKIKRAIKKKALLNIKLLFLYKTTIT